MNRIRLAALLLCLVLPTRAGAFALLNEQTYTTQKGAWDVKVLDLNNDGKPEIIAALFDHEWVAVLPNDGHGRFPAGQTQYPSNQNSALELADVSGDHKPDLATANYNVNSMSVRIGSGVGGFGNKTNYPTGVHPRDLVAADFDGDGYRDYAVACEDGSVTIVKNRGVTGLDPVTVTFSVGGSLRSIAAADFDRNGKVDLVVLDRGGGRVLPLKNLGGFQFDKGTAVPVPTSANDLLARDLSDDNWPDVAVANGEVDPYGQGSLSILLNDRTGAFLPKQNYPDVESAKSIEAADFDGDGILDLLTCSQGQGLVRVSIGLGGGAFGGAVEGRANGPIVAAAGDVDGDGRLDVVTGNYLAGTVSVLMNRPASPGGPYHFKAVSNIVCDVGGYDVVVGDLNRDGHPDAVGAILDGNEVEVFLNLGDGTGRLADPARYAGGQAVAVDVGDYSGDGWPDVASANYAQGTMSLRLNQGDGTLAAPVDVATGVQPRCLAGADFDGDGLRDLVIGTFGGQFLTRKGIPGGLGPVVTQFSLSAGFKGASTGDLDGDGRPDVALVDAVNRKVYVMRNVDGASFSFLQILSLSNKLSDVVIKDLDGDGDQDLGLVNEDNLVQVCLNDGLGHFPTARPFAIGLLAQTIDAADLDGNGLPELVVPIYNQNRVQALTNIGGGYFDGMTEAVTGARPRAAACADFDGDGRIDVVTMDFGAGTLHVLRNLAGPGPPPQDPYPCQGPRYSTPMTPVHAVALDLDGDGHGDFAATGVGLLSIYRRLDTGAPLRQDVATGPSPQAVAGGDLDGDGLPELAVANQGDNTVSIYRNHVDGSFTPLAQLPVGARPRFVALADLNRDGRLDIATANEGDAEHPPSITILFNPQGATWNPVAEPVDAEAIPSDPPTAQAGSPPDTNETARVDLPSPGGAVMLAVADLDGDGANDLVVNTPGAHAVAIRYQIAPGRFGPATERPAGGSAWTAIADFDLDGRPDLAIADPEFDLVRVLWNAAVDPFTAETDIPVEDDPRAVAAGDLVHDGRPDIAYVSSAEGWYGVLKTDTFRDIRYWTRCISGPGARSVALAACEWGELDAFVVNGDEGTIFRAWGCNPLLARDRGAQTDTADRPVAAFALGRPMPNPTISQASITFALPERGPAHLGVYDVRGRLVKTLVHGVQEAGEHRAAWYGTNEGGARVAAGVYFCRLTCAAGTKVERMVFVGR